jgi:hypothetical protein
MSRNFVFPSPASCKPKDRAVLCTAERIIKLYNQSNTDQAQRISKKVKRWFADTAAKRGWAGAHFLPEVQSGHGAGCVLFLPPTSVNVTVLVKNTTLVLEAQTGDE